MTDPRCQHCHRPKAEHMTVVVTKHLDVRPSMLLLCPTALYAPACEMCDRHPCRCADVFTPIGEQPPTYPDKKVTQ